jgi:hypothetical protein
LYSFVLTIWRFEICMSNSSLNATKHNDEDAGMIRMSLRTMLAYPYLGW